MNLPAFALFERSLRLESRSALMTWSRVGLLGIILFVLLPTQAGARAGIFGAHGLNFLRQMVWTNFWFISLAGLSYFASTITEEKEEMMLGLLRMTDLNAVAILLGKSTSRLVGAFAAAGRANSFYPAGGDAWRRHGPAFQIGNGRLRDLAGVSVSCSLIWRCCSR